MKHSPAALRIRPRPSAEGDSYEIVGETAEVLSAPMSQKDAVAVLRHLKEHPPERRRDDELEQFGAAGSGATWPAVPYATWQLQEPGEHQTDPPHVLGTLRARTREAAIAAVTALGFYLNRPLAATQQTGDQQPAGRGFRQGHWIPSFYSAQERDRWFDDVFGKSASEFLQEHAATTDTVAALESYTNPVHTQAVFLASRYGQERADKWGKDRLKELSRPE